MRLDGEGVALLLDVGHIGHLGDLQLLSDLGAHLGGVAVDGLTAAEDDVILVHTQVLDGGSQDLGGGEGIGAAELAGGHQHGLVHAHGLQLQQHAGGGRGPHGHGDDGAAQLILQGQGGFDGVHIIGVDDGLHGGAVEGAIGVDGHLAGGIRHLLDTYDKLHSILAPFRVTSANCRR